MIRLVLRSAIDKVEREWNADASDASDMNDASLHAAWVVSRVTDLLAAAALVVGFGIPTPDRGLRGRRRWVLASDVRVVTDGGGKVRAALNVIDGADRVARFLVDATRKRPGAWWRRLHAALCDHQRPPRCHRGRPEGPVQTAAFEIDGDVIRGLYVVRNPDKLRHLAAATSHERGPE